MKLLSLEMLNIRSYHHQKIDFPEGSFLLSGDIGFGKSTILLAIEFSLFGFGDIMASSLLRRGEREGKTRLEFELEGQNIVVGRSLQKKGETISQTTGYISIDGSRREMTPTELKAEVLNLLGYPKDLFTKQKNPIYRYTVYTPQEEMKQILSSKRDDRMEILRRIFGVDRYKIIKDNSNNLRLELKRKASNYDALSKDLKEKENDLKIISEKKEKLIKEVHEIKKRLDGFVLKESSLSKNSEELDEKFGEFQKISNEISSKEGELRSYEQNLSNFNIKINQILKDKDGIDIEKEIETLETKIKNISEKLSKSKEKREILNTQRVMLGRLEVEISNKNETLQKISEEITSKKNLLSSFEGPYTRPITELRNEILEIQKNIERIYQKKEGVNSEIDKLLKLKERYNSKILEYKEKNSVVMGAINSIENDLSSLNNLKDMALCPLCKQSISEDHRKSEIKRINEEKTKLKTSLKNTKELITKLEIKLQGLEKELENKSRNIIMSQKDKIEVLEKLIKETETFNLVTKELVDLNVHLESLKNEINEKTKNQTQILNEIEKLSPVEFEINELEKNKESCLEILNRYREALNIKKEKEILEARVDSLSKNLKNLKESAKEFSGIESEKQKINQELKKVSAEKLKMEREEAEKSKEIELLQNDISRVKNEIEVKNKHVHTKEKLENIANWIDNYFISLMETMERDFMESLRMQFEDYFSKWLENLLEGNELEASIDEDFTPILRQEGFDAEYESLSGGERTSVALAYRLALNRIINNLIDEIKTQDLIILDEPTDGFSRKQLDKVRDVLDMLGMSQVIIVSHEPEIESCVDHVLRVTKRDGVSRIESQSSFSKATVGI